MGRWRFTGPGLLATLCLASCRFAPTDAFAHAEYAARRGQFLSALDLLDQVPPSHRRYSEARTFAQALERRIRTSHEMILEGLALRTEWRDEEAIDRFEQALAIWSDVAAAEGLIHATKNRIAVLGTGRRNESPALARTNTETESYTELPAVTTSPLELSDVRLTMPIEPSIDDSKTSEPATVPAAPGPSAESGNGERKGEPTRVVMTGVKPMTTVTAPMTTVTVPVTKGVKPTGTDVAKSSARSMRARAKARRTRRLADARRLLGRGERDGALLILHDLWDEAPTDVRVVAELGRVLHQRALLAYGQGLLEAAIDDWKKVVRLQKKNAQAKAFLRAAQTELAGRNHR